MLQSLKTGLEVHDPKGVHDMTIEQGNAPAFLDRFAEAFREEDANVDTKSAENDNVQIIRGLFQAVMHNDKSAFKNSLSADVEMEIIGPDSVPFRGRWKYPDAVTDAVWNNFAMVESQQTTIVSVIAQGDYVINIATETGKYRKSGESYDYLFVQQFQIKNRLVTRIREIVAPRLP